MKRFSLLILLLSVLSYSAVNAQLHRPAKELEKKNGWFGTIQAGYNFAFGDDSWNIWKDYQDAKGGGFSVSVGKELSTLLSARLKGRYLDLYNRINLEMYEEFKYKYPDYLPRNGFYGYKVASLQAELMFNLTNLFRDRSSRHFFNMYLVGGFGENIAFCYDEVCDYWDGEYAPGLIYKVDKRSHLMPVGCIGGILDFRLDNDISLNIEALGSITGDKLEGVKYEEWYDVYITLCIGATIYF